MKVRDIYSFIDSFAPFSSQASWDNSGLLIGDENAYVKKALVSLDVTDCEITQALNLKANLIISHHPVIFNPCKNFLCGSICYKAAKGDINVISAHTNLDKAANGVNDTLCEKLNMNYEKMSEDIADGFLNMGSFEIARTPRSLADYIKKCLGGTVGFCDAGNKIKKAAVCSGSGANFIQEAMKLGCDALITGEASYHNFLDAKNMGLSLFAAGHFESEAIIVEKLLKMLSKEFKDIEFMASESLSPIATVI